VAARQQVGRTVVRAPFDGIVSDRKVSAGDTAAIGKELLKVIDPTSMRFEGRSRPTRSAPSRSASRSCSASTATATSQFAGVVKRIDPSANDVTRQVEVLVGFAGGKQPRVAGLYAEGRIDAEQPTP
jgi:membrane fusion protein (multidrug efflux system)